MIARVVLLVALVPGCALFSGLEAADVRAARDTVSAACAACADPVVAGEHAEECADLVDVCHALNDVCDK